ncbi:MAG: hypothetical protein QM702_12635 [Rubrivivax sp.]
MRPAIPLPLIALLAGCNTGGYVLMAATDSAGSGAAPPDPQAASLVLPLEVNPQVAETFVRIGYGLPPGQRFQSYEFLTPRLRTRQAAPLVRLVKRYNEFDGERVAEAIEKLRGRVSGVEFGREGSPVIYLDLPYWTHQREESPPDAAQSRIADAEHQRFVGELRRVFVEELGADEFTEQRRRVRIWWD